MECDYYRLEIARAAALFSGFEGFRSGTFDLGQQFSFAV